MTSVTLYWLLTVLVIVFPAVQGGDIDESWPNMSSSYSLTGSATRRIDVIELTPNSTNQGGRALYNNPVDASAGFSLLFEFVIYSINPSGESISFIVTGDKESFLTATQTDGANWNVAYLQNMVAVVQDLSNLKLLICQVNATTQMPLRSEITTECKSTVFLSPAVGWHNTRIEYIPVSGSAYWLISVDGRNTSFVTDPVPINPVVPNEYYFGWAASNGDTKYNDKSLRGWTASFSVNPCQASNGGCSVNATCAVLDGVSITCTCKNGFEGDGYNCTEVAVPPVAPPVASPVAPPSGGSPAAPGVSPTPVEPPVEVPVTPSVESPLQPPVSSPSEQLLREPTPPGPETLVPAIVVPVVAAGVAVFLGVYFGKKRQARQKKEKFTKGLDDPEMTGSGSASLIALNSDTGTNPATTPPSYATMPVATDRSSVQYNRIPTNPGISLATNDTKTNQAGTSSDIDKKMLIPFDSLVFVKEIGAGSYGKVYAGEWNGAEVAIKVNNSVTDMDGFLAEAKLTLGIAPHPNLVQTFGISLDGSNPCIVLEFCGGGSLDKLVFGEAGGSISDTKRKEIALKIAYGLIHLHNNNIVHRDLAARNILLNSEGQPKVSDFGMSRVIDEGTKGKTKTNIGPLRWMSPESLKDRTYSIKSDVWSYGILVWEIVAGREPHEEEDQLFVGVKIRDEAFHPAIPDNCDPVLREVMEMCWKKDPNDRPTMAEIAKILRKS